MNPVVWIVAACVLFVPLATYLLLVAGRREGPGAVAPSRPAARAVRTVTTEPVVAGSSVGCGPDIVVLLDDDLDACRAVLDVSCRRGCEVCAVDVVTDGRVAASRRRLQELGSSYPTIRLAQVSCEEDDRGDALVRFISSRYDERHTVVVTSAVAPLHRWAGDTRGGLALEHTVAMCTECRVVPMTLRPDRQTGRLVLDPGAKALMDSSVQAAR